MDVELLSQDAQNAAVTSLYGFMAGAWTGDIAMPLEDQEAGAGMQVLSIDFGAGWGH